jgi:hypothetical protein
MTLLYILGALVLIIILLLLVALFLPNGYFIERSAIIKKPCDYVMDKVADLHNYAKWNPWQQTESNLKYDITGSPKRPGHRFSWKGAKAGTGRLTIRDIDSKHVHFNLEFLKPLKSSARDNWLFEEWGNGETKITWQNEGTLPYPVGRLIGYLLHKHLSRQFTAGLNNLKKLCENNKLT